MTVAKTPFYKKIELACCFDSDRSKWPSLCMPVNVPCDVDPGLQDIQVSAVSLNDSSEALPARKLLPLTLCCQRLERGLFYDAWLSQLNHRCHKRSCSTFMAFNQLMLHVLCFCCRFLIFGGVLTTCYRYQQFCRDWCFQHLPAATPLMFSKHSGLRGYSYPAP